MHLNILVLQQVLKDVQADSNLDHAAHFWSWFEDEPGEVVKAVGYGQLSRQEARELVRLWGSARGDAHRVEVEEALRGLE